jgi:hypothetical protein
MVWFKVDDRFHASDPVKLIPRDQRAAAIGLWTLAGTWSAQFLKDGFVPQHMVDDFGGTPEMADCLIQVGLWKRQRTGFKFTDWDKWQPTREKVELKHEVEAKRQADYRARKAANAGASHAPVTHNESVSHAPVRSSRPDPTRPDPLKEKASIQPAVELSRDFEMFWEIYPRKQAKVDALKAYTAVRKKVDAKTIRAGAQAYALLNIGLDKNLIKMAGGWLRGERWADEQIVNATRQTVIGSEKFCEIHPDYPITAHYPCEACSRNVGLSDGREF